MDPGLYDSFQLPGQYYPEKITILKYPLCLRNLFLIYLILIIIRLLRHLPLVQGKTGEGVFVLPFDIVNVSFAVI